MVISVFAGLGKTTVGQKYPNVCDLQSSPFRCVYGEYLSDEYEKLKYDSSRVINKEWPENYLRAIKEAVNKYDIVLVPSSLDVRELLINNGIDFVFVMPSVEMKEELLSRYMSRGNSKEMIDDVMSNFENWSRVQGSYLYKLEILKPGQYLEDLLIEKGYLKGRRL